MTALSPGARLGPYQLSLDGGTPTPLTDEGVTVAAVSPDGRSLAVVLADNTRAVRA